MAGPALDHAYRYLRPSSLERVGSATHLELATSGGGEAPHFFTGQLTAPKRAADAMLTVVRVARSRFHVPAAMLARILAESDPVVTCQDGAVRFESFSACCGVYARLDLDAGALRAEHAGRGATNVDFNAEMRALLARVRPTEDVRLAVGRDELRVTRRTKEHAAADVVERRVALPLRWLRGFGEVAAVAARMTPQLEVSGVEARKLLRALPRPTGGGGKPAWVTHSGKGLRLARHDAAGAVRVAGIERASLLVDVAGDAQRLVLYGEPSGASAWELHHPEARFVLLLSPEPWRGFSGEGGLLEDLARSRTASAVAAVRASLTWQASIDAAGLARAHGLAATEVSSALAALAARGLVGYDLAKQAYFHRELPFAMDAIESMHPRLEAARKLVAAAAVEGLAATEDRVTARVRSTDGVAYAVRGDGDAWRCTCTWYAKHKDTRGPCKHVLSVQLSQEAP